VDQFPGHRWTFDSRFVLRGEISRLKSLRKKYDLPERKHLPSSAAIAKRVDLKKEHDALFKLFSKLVHPSSYLINDYENAASSEVKMILKIHAQLYAWDTFSRVCSAVSVPQTIREVSHSITGGDA